MPDTGFRPESKFGLRRRRRDEKDRRRAYLPNFVGPLPIGVLGGSGNKSGFGLGHRTLEPGLVSSRLRRRQLLDLRNIPIAVATQGLGWRGLFPEMRTPPGEINLPSDIREIFREERAVEKEKVPRIPLVAAVEDLAEHERRAFPIVPIKRPAAGLRFRNAPGFQLIEFNEDPLQAARLRPQQTLQHIAAFRREHSIYSEIEGARRMARFAHDPIENRRRDLMMDAAGTDKDCVELVPVLLEKTELGTDDVDFRKRKERVQAGADQNKGEHRDPDIQEAPAKGKIGLRRIG